MGSPKRWRQIQVWRVEIGDFRPISRYILETVQERDLASMIPNYTESPTLFSTFCIAFDIFIVSGDRDFKNGK